MPGLHWLEEELEISPVQWTGRDSEGVWDVGFGGFQVKPWRSNVEKTLRMAESRKHKEAAVFLIPIPYPAWAEVFASALCQIIRP